MSACWCRPAAGFGQTAGAKLKSHDLQVAELQKVPSRVNSSMAKLRIPALPDTSSAPQPADEPGPSLPQQQLPPELQRPSLAHKPGRQQAPALSSQSSLEGCIQAAQQLPPRQSSTAPQNHALSEVLEPKMSVQARIRSLESKSSQKLDPSPSKPFQRQQQRQQQQQQVQVTVQQPASRVSADPLLPQMREVAHAEEAAPAHAPAQPGQDARGQPHGAAQAQEAAHPPAQEQPQQALQTSSQVDSQAGQGSTPGQQLASRPVQLPAEALAPEHPHAQAHAQAQGSAERWVEPRQQLVARYSKPLLAPQLQPADSQPHDQAPLQARLLQQQQQQQGQPGSVPPPAPAASLAGATDAQAFGRSLSAGPSQEQGRYAARELMSDESLVAAYEAQLPRAASQPIATSRQLYFPGSPSASSTSEASLAPAKQQLLFTPPQRAAPRAAVPALQHSGEPSAAGQWSDLAVCVRACVRACVLSDCRLVTGHPTVHPEP